MKTKCMVFFVIFVFAIASYVSVLSNVNAATKEEIENAVVKGLGWLSTQQEIDGSWRFDRNAGNCYTDIATTAFVLLKFVERAKELGKNPFDTDPNSPTYYGYAANVIAGFNYIFANVWKDSEDLVYFPCYPTYSTGTTMMAIAASNAPSRGITVGQLNGWTFQQALQGMVDWMAYAQQKDVNFPCNEGGWDYIADPLDTRAWADQSNTGYATLGLGFAAAPPPNGFGMPVPQAVLDELNKYIAKVQDANGGSWYEPCTLYKWINILKTGNLLYEMALVGDEPIDTRVQNAITYVQNHWNDTGQQPEFPSTSLGWKDSYQAMFTLMKGLEAFGITELTVGSSEIDWFDEVSNVIVANQNADGSWKRINASITEGEQSANLRAAWAMLTLERVVPTVVEKVFVDIKPGSCPNPLNVKSKGVLPVAVLGTEDFDITTIDPATVRLSREGVDAEVAPLRWSLEDAATPFEGDLCGCHALYGDGYTDLSFKFDTQALVGTLILGDVVGQTIPLTLTGNLKEEFGGTPIRGQDCIRVQQ